jgi:hypothetical protein
MTALVRAGRTPGEPGGGASGIALSVWLLTFLSFIFLTLAFLKRCSELHALRKSEEKAASRRGYVMSDLAMAVPVVAGDGAGFMHNDPIVYVKPKIARLGVMVCVIK